MGNRGTDSARRGAMRAAWLAGALLLALAVRAEDEHRIADEYAWQVTAAQSLPVLGADLFGDRTDPYSGRTEFAVTDVSLPGNDALPVRIGRHFVVEDRGGVTLARAFGDWDLDLPHLHGIFAHTAGSSSSGWLASMPDPAQRCSVAGELLAPPPDAAGSQGGTFAAGEYWAGNWLYVPGGGDQELMVVTPENPHRPADGASYYWVTAGQWFFSCLPATANGVAGEGFLARAPDGTRYWFDRPVKRPAAILKKPWGSGPLDLARSSTDGTITPQVVSDQVLLQRDEVWILPSRIEDRFGNAVTFAYDAASPWRLLAISASDGRQLTLSYDASGRISKVSDGGRNWAYSYGTSNSLTRVTQPDGSRWQYSLAAVAAARIAAEPDSSLLCEVRSSAAAQSTTTGTVTHPSGAVGQFRFRPALHGRSWVPKQCIYQDQNRRSSYALYPYLFDTLALLDKTISGPGLSGSLVWSYSYGAPNQAWAEQCQGTGCAGTKAVTVSEPDGTVREYTYGNRYRTDEGKLLELRSRNGAGGAELRRELHDYQLTAAGQGYPARVGISPNARGDGAGETPQPEWRRRTIQQGVTFTWQAQGFDGFARPAAVSRGSDLGFSRSELIEYHDDYPAWVLGQQRRLTETGNGRVVSEIDYDSRSQPWRRHEFGLLRETRGYHPNGSLASVTDGNGQATALIDWHRGVPRRIAFPDGTAIAATVSDQGWITSATDANGYQTRYSYDALGRLRKLTPPGGDSVSWSATSMAFAAVSGSEYGIGAGHWRRTESRGNYRRVTYYDALWRPVIEREYDNADAAGTQRFRGWRYDPAGRTSFVGRPRSTASSIASFTEGTSTDYDGLGRPVTERVDSELGPLVTTTAWLDGFRRAVTDPRGNVATTAFQAFDEPDTGQPVEIVAAEGRTTRITRDVFGKALVISRDGPGGGQARQYVYDANERLCKQLAPETGATVFDYDGAGNVAWSAEGSTLTGPSCDRSAVPAGQRISRSYDPLNRLTVIDYPGSSADTQYGYTPDGLLASLAADGSRWSYSYNRLRLLTGETLAVDGRSFAFSRTYNSLGYQTRQGYPAGSQVALSLNALGQATAVSGYASGMRWAADGTLLGLTLANGVVRTVEQNPRGLPARISEVKSGSAALLDEYYSYDGNGNVTAIADGAGGRNLSYDGLDRLTLALGPWGSANYGYDSHDNLVSADQGSRRYRYQYDANRLVRIEDPAGVVLKAFSYNAAGDPVSRSGQGHSWDAAHRLRAVTGVASYGYDGHGRRIRETPAGGGSSYPVYDRDGRKLYLAGASGERRRYVYAGPLLIAEDRFPASGSATRQYLHTDALGSVAARSDTAGARVGGQAWGPWGGLSGMLPDGPGYTGHDGDPETGLVYAGQRYYDPDLGRFLTPDPVPTDTVAGELFNRYAYANNNPYRFVDPDGRLFETAWDLYSLASGLRSLAGNLRQGNWGAAAVDAAGVVADGAAVALPGVPGGAGLAIGTIRAAADGAATQVVRAAGETAGSASRVLSETRYTQSGEKFYRYESANPAFSRVTPGGGVTPGTYAAPESDGLVLVGERVSKYNLPSPSIPRPNAFLLEPPAGTLVIGPKSVSGGTGNEVVFPLGF